MSEHHQSRFPLRPRTKRAMLFTVIGGVVVVGAAAVALIYFVIFPTSSPAPFALTKSPSPTKGQTGVSSAAQLAGRWRISSGSQAGYRVRERLAFLPAASQAVGRTSSITGSATFTASPSKVKVTKASFLINVTTLTSDHSQRDEKIRVIGLESDRYPTASFVLSAPITLPTDALSGQTVAVPASGLLTLHGTTRRETIPLKMSVSGSEVQAVGSSTFPWSRFNMIAPSVGGFVTVTNSATMEFDLRLRRA